MHFPKFQSDRSPPEQHRARATTVRTTLGPSGFWSLPLAVTRQILAPPKQTGAPSASDHSSPHIIPRRRLLPLRVVQPCRIRIRIRRRRGGSRHQRVGERVGMADTVETMDDGAMACTTLSAFPFLTPDEFDAACRALAERTRSCTAAQLDGGWSSARLVTQVYPCRRPA